MVVTPPRMRKGGKASYTVYKPAWNDGQPKPVVPQVQPPKPKLNGNHLAGTGSFDPCEREGQAQWAGSEQPADVWRCSKGHRGSSKRSRSIERPGSDGSRSISRQEPSRSHSSRSSSRWPTEKGAGGGKQPPADDRRPSKPSTAGNAKKGQAQARKKSPKKDNSPPGRGPGGANGVGLKASKATAALITGDSAVA